MPLAARERRFPPKKSALPAAGGRSAPVERKRGKEKQQFRLVFSSFSASQFRLGATHTTRSRLRTYVRPCGRPPRYITGGAWRREGGGVVTFFYRRSQMSKGGKAKSAPDVPPHCPCLTVLQQGEGRGGRAKDFPRP